MSMPTLAITGGTGFVGGHLLKAARAAGHEVRALTRGWRPEEPGIQASNHSSIFHRNVTSC